MAENNKKSRRDLSPGGFLFRPVGALVLVLATYNPSGTSFVHWVQDAFSGSTLGALHVFVGVLIVIGWVIYIAASYRSLGLLGMVLGAAFFAALIWLLIDLGILSIESATSISWIVLICLAGLLAIGVSWSHIWRRLTGQLEVDED